MRGPAASSSTSGTPPSGTSFSTRDTNSSASSPEVHLPRPTSPVPAKCQGSSSTCSLRLASSITSSKRSEEHTSELQSLAYLVCRLLLEKKKKKLHTHF